VKIGAGVWPKAFLALKNGSDDFAGSFFTVMKDFRDPGPPSITVKIGASVWPKAFLTLKNGFARARPILLHGDESPVEPNREDRRRDRPPLEVGRDLQAGPSREDKSSRYVTSPFGLPHPAQLRRSDVT